MSSLKHGLTAKGVESLRKLLIELLVKDSGSDTDPRAAMADELCNMALAALAVTPSSTALTSISLEEAVRIVIQSSGRDTGRRLEEKLRALPCATPLELDSYNAGMEAATSIYNDALEGLKAQYRAQSASGTASDAARWREYAEHQEHCATCGEAVDDCPDGSRLRSVARG